MLPAVGACVISSWYTQYLGIGNSICQNLNLYATFLRIFNNVDQYKNIFYLNVGSAYLLDFKNCQCFVLFTFLSRQGT